MGLCRLFSLFFCLFAMCEATTIYAAQLTIDYSQPPKTVKKEGVVEVWGKTPQGKPILIGTLRSIPRGTLFYHWTRKSEDEVAEDLRNGGLSEEDVRKLVAGGGRVGGGFYVSDNPMDSRDYGDILEVAKLPKTALAFNRSLPVQSDAEKNLINQYAQNLPNVRVMAVDGKQTWYSLVSPQDLTQVHMGGASDILNWLETSQEVPAPNEIRDIAGKFSTESGFQKYVDQSLKYIDDVKGDTRVARQSFKLLQERGSEMMLTDAYLKANPALLTAAAVDRQLERLGSDASNLKFLGLLSRSGDPKLFLRFAAGYVSKPQSGTATTVLSYLFRDLPSEPSPARNLVIQNALSSSNPIAQAEAEKFVASRNMTTVGSCFMRGLKKSP